MTRGADLVVVYDLQSVRTATKWEVSLHGGGIANVDYIKSVGARGACIFFKAAVMSMPLQVWVSAAFALRFPEERQILEAALGSDGSMWNSFAGSNVEFVTRALKENQTCWTRHARGVHRIPTGLREREDCGEIPQRCALHRRNKVARAPGVTS